MMDGAAGRARQPGSNPATAPNRLSVRRSPMPDNAAKEGTGRHRADDVLLLALATGATVEGAAAQADVSESTVYRRLADPEFADRLQQMRAAMVQRATALLTTAAAQAVQTLT